MFQTKFVKKIKSHIVCSVTFFFSESSSIYEMMWNNWYSQTGHVWQYKYDTVHSLCVLEKLIMCHTYSFSTATVVSRTRLIVRYISLEVHCLSCFITVQTVDTLWSVDMLRSPNDMFVWLLAIALHTLQSLSSNESPNMKLFFSIAGIVL